MDASDRLEDDFKFYLSFFEQNFKDLRNERDKALCQEWLRRLEGMRGNRKQRRDRNVYLSQLALAMAEGQLFPPFNAPPPREPLPIPASLFEMFRPGVTVNETPQESKSEISSPYAKADKCGSDLSFRGMKGKWALISLQAPESIEHDELQTSRSQTSSLSTRADTAEEYLPNGEINEQEAPEETVHEKSQTNLSEMSSPSARSDISGKHRPNGDINERKSPEKTVHEKSQTNLSEMSSPSARSDFSGKHRPNGDINEWKSPEKTVSEKSQEDQSMRPSPSTITNSSEKHRLNENVGRESAAETIVYEKTHVTRSDVSASSAKDGTSEKTKKNGNINIHKSAEETVQEKPKKKQTVTTSPSARDVNNEKHRPNASTNRVSSPETSVFEKPQTNQSEMPSPSTRAATIDKYFPNVALGKERSKRNNNRKQAAGENVSQKSETTLSDMSSLGSLSDKSVQKWLATNYKEDESTLALYSPEEFVPQDYQMMLFKIPFFYASSETSTERMSQTRASDKTSAAEEPVPRKSPTVKSEVPPCISSSDFNEEQASNSSEKNKPSNETLLPVGEKELHSRKLSDSQTDGLPNYSTTAVKNKQPEQPELLSETHSDSWTKFIPSYRIHSEKKLDFKQPELKPVDYSYYRTCVLSKDKLNSEEDLYYQSSRVQSTNFFDSRINVLSNATLKPDVDESLEQPVVSRTCPRPSQMPLVEEKLESESTNDEFVTSQWKTVVPQDEAVSHVGSLDSIISYSKGQWLDESCDSFLSTFTVPSGMSENSGEINHYFGSPSVHSELHQGMKLSEKEIQSISLQSCLDESRKSTPALSSTSVISKGEWKIPRTSATHSVKDEYTQTQSQKHLPQKENFQRKPMCLPVYVVSADQQPFVLYTPLTPSQIHGRQLIIPTASQLPSTSQQLQQQRRLRKTPKQSSKINARVHFS